MRRFILAIYRILRRRFHFPMLVLFSVFALIMLIEAKYPYYFLQDDNRDYYLPYFKHACDALKNGELALYNFHQFMGHPVLSIGQTGVLYPLMYISASLSNSIFGHIYAAIDIEILIHLMIGGLGMYYLLSYLSIRPRSAYFGAITWCFSSMIIFTSSSWVIISGVAAWFPWMVFYSLRILDRLAAKVKTTVMSNVIILVIIRLMLFYQGNVQYFIYAMMFEVIFAAVYAIIYLREKLKRKYLKTIAVFSGGIVLTIVFALPLLLPMWNQMNNSALRASPLPFEEFSMEIFDIGQWLIGLVNPFYNVTEDMIWAYRRHINLTFVGYTMLLLLVFMSVYWIGYVINRIKRNPIERETIKSCKLYTLAFIPGITAFLFSASYAVNRIVYLIPILNRFRFQFKFQVFTVFFIIIAGCTGLKLLSRKISGIIRPWLKSMLTIIIILLQIAGFSILYIIGPPRNFGTHKDLPPLHEPIAEVFGNDRYLSADFNLFGDKEFDYTGFNTYTAHTLGFNYATLFSMNQIAGYEQLVSSLNNEKCRWVNNWAIYNLHKGFPFNYFREYGVKWYVTDPKNTDSQNIIKDQRGISLYLQEDNRAIYKDSYAVPMVFTTDIYGIRSSKHLDLDIGVNILKITGIDTSAFPVPVSTDDAQYENWFDEGYSEWGDYYYIVGDNKLTVNFLYNKYFTAKYLDGSIAELEADNYGRISARIPDGCAGITIKYRDPYFEAGLVIAAAFLFLGISVLIIRKRFFAK